MNLHSNTKSYKGEAVKNRSLRLLDYPEILSDLSHFSTFDRSKVMVMNMKPSYHKEEVTDLLQKTSEGRFLLEKEGNLSCSSIQEIGDYTKRASLAGVLTGEELLIISDTLDTVENLRNVISHYQEECPKVYDLSRHITNVSYLTYSIRSKLTPNGLVRDDATPTLGLLRKQVRQAYDRVTNALQRLIEANQLTGVIQDDVISVRSDRLVLQIKSNMRSKIPGVIHDVSNTHQTIFIEPFSTINLCNSWRELILEEAQEVEKVLKELSDSVGQESTLIQQNVDTTAELDLVLTKSRYSNHLAAPVPSGLYHAKQKYVPKISIKEARHPVLGNTAVPLSVEIGPNWHVLVITGPNTGGKTVALKTIGLLALMNQSGIHISAEKETLIPVFNGIYADIGDQQSLQQSVSSFSSHINSLNDIIEYSDKDSLVILDEIGSSTNPEEGAAIAIGVIQYLAEQNIHTLVTTHHTAVAAHAELSDLMKNASFTLHPDTLEPTYQITMDIPGGSFAMAVAKRLGLNQKVLALAEKYLPHDTKNISDTLDEIRHERQQQASITKDTQDAFLQSSKLRQELQAEIKYLNDHKSEIIRSFHQSAKDQYYEAGKILDMARSALSWSKNIGPQNQDIVRVNSTIEQIEKTLSENPIADTLFDTPTQQGFSINDSVVIKDLDLTGVVTSVEEGAAEIEVMVGNVRLTVGRNRLSHSHTAHINNDINANNPSISYPLTEGNLELDIRGMRAEEALINLEQFLDDSVRSGLSQVRVIHGKGTGALRQAVRSTVKSHPLVNRYESEADSVGGDGSTVILLN